MLTVAQYAARVGVSAKTIYAMVERGEITAHRFGRLIRINSEEADTETLYQPGPGTSRIEAPLRPRPATGKFSRRAREVG